MKFTCDQCNTRYSIADEKVEGKVLKIRCKVCEFTMVVRGGESRVGGSIGSSMSVASAMMEPLQEIEWYAAPDNQQIGPVPIERVRAMIRSRTIVADTLLWNENLNEWTAAESIDALKSMFPPPLRSGPPPIPEQAHVDDEQLLDPQPIIDQTIPNEHSQTEDGPLEAPTEIGAFADVHPIASRDTLQYASPEMSEPLLGQASIPLDADTVRSTAALTEDLPDPSDFPEDLLPILEDPPVVETEAYPPAEAGRESSDRTELMDLDELLDLPGPAPVKAEATRRIEREDDFGPTANDSLSGEILGGMAPQSLPAIPDGDHQLSDSSVGDDEMMPPEFGEGSYSEPVGDSSPALLETEHFVPDIDLESVDEHQPELSISSEQVAEDNAILRFSDAPIAIPADGDFKDVTSKRLGQEAIVTERRDGPRVKADKAPVSPGLIVAACIIGMAAMFCAVYLLTKKKPAEKASVIAAVPKAMDAATAHVLAKPDAVAAVASKKDVSTVKTVQDAGAPVPDATKGAVEAVPKVEPTAHKNVPKRRVVTKKKFVANTGKRVSTKGSGKASQPKIRTRRNFMLAKGPSSDVPDPRLKSRKAESEKTVSSGLSQTELVEVINKYRAGLNGCYQRHLKGDPTFSPGRLMLRFRIRPSGRTSQVSIGKKYGDTVLKKCLDRLVRRWRFPPFKGPPFDTEFPLLFQRQF